METKEPGYYRKLMESIEAGIPAAAAAAPVSEDNKQAPLSWQVNRKDWHLNLARNIHADLGKALNSQDPSEVSRLVQGAYNSMEEVIMAIRQGGLNEMGRYGSRGPRRGDTVDAGIGYLLTRDAGTPDEGQVDVYITFTATILSPGYAATRDDPAEGSEWEFEINDIELDLPKGMTPSPEEQLTPQEKAQITAWFERREGQYRASEAANDKYDPSEQGDY
jgi:hypothetical protein